MIEPATQPTPDDRPLLTVEDACRLILKQVQALPLETTPLLQTAGRFARETLFATHMLPGFDNSSMDGYALNIGDVTGQLPAGTTLEVVGEQPAGSSRDLQVCFGQAVRIFTGAPLPQGSDAVIMQEDVLRDGNTIVLKETVRVGEFIRRAGGDLAHGQKLIEAGDKLTPQRLGLLASQGIAQLAISRVPSVAVLATGDELRGPGQPLGAGEIYESNGVMLAALASGLGVRVTVLERAHDDRADLDAKIEIGLREHDALVVAGGVSVGDRDFVKERLTAAGVEIDLWRVFMQPGKPFLHGRFPSSASINGAHIFGLPGNPVSAFVTFLLFVRPALLRLMGASLEEARLPRVPSTAGVDLVNRGNRPHYLRGSLDGKGQFNPSGRQESHALYTLSRSDALARLEPGATIKAGGPVEAMVWD